jgi:hypothetical protein
MSAPDPKHLLTGSAAPLMTREAFAAAIGLPLGVLIAQCERGYWPMVRKGKRVFVNVESVRQEALQCAAESKAAPAAR